MVRFFGKGTSSERIRMESGLFPEKDADRRLLDVCVAAADDILVDIFDADLARVSGEAEIVSADVGEFVIFRIEYGIVVGAADAVSGPVDEMVAVEIADPLPCPDEPVSFHFDHRDV